MTREEYEKQLREKRRSERKDQVIIPDFEDLSPREQYERDLKRRNAQKAQESLAMRASSLGQNISSIYTDIYNRYQGQNSPYRSDASEWYDKINSASTGYQSEYAKIMATLSKYKGYIDEDWQKNLTDYLNAGKTYYDQALEQASLDKDFQTQFGSQASYDNFLRMQENKNRTDAMSAEELKAEADREKASQPLSSRTYQAMINERLASGDSDVSDLQDKMTESKKWEQGSDRILYYDQNGYGVTYDRLYREKTAENTWENLTSDTEAYRLYEKIKEEEPAIMAQVQSGEDSQAAGNDMAVLLADKQTLSQMGYDYDQIAYYQKYKADKEGYQDSIRDAQNATPFKAAVFSIATAPMQAAEYAGNAFYSAMSLGDDSSAYGLANTYDDKFRSQASTMLQGATQMIDEHMANKGRSQLARWLATGAYSGIVSSMQSVAQVAVCKLLFPVGGEAISLGLMASNAANQQFAESIKAGATNGEALLTSLGAGINEALFEKLSIESLDGIDNIIRNQRFDFNSFESFLKSLAQSSPSLLMQGLTEGSEELFTDIANAIWDQFVNGDNSEYARTVKEYMDQGYDSITSGKMATQKFFSDLASSFYGGFVGGLSSGGTHVIYGTADMGIRNTLGASALGRDISQNNNVDLLINQANELGDANVSKRAEKLAQTETPSNRQIGRLAQEVRSRTKSNIINEHSNAFRTEIESKLSDMPEAERKQAVDAISKYQRGEVLTAKELKTFTKVGGRDIVDSITNDEEAMERIRTSIEENPEVAKNQERLAESALFTKGDVKEMRSVEGSRAGEAIDEAKAKAEGIKDVQEAKEATAKDFMKQMGYRQSTMNAVMAEIQSSGESINDIGSFILGVNEAINFGKIGYQQKFIKSNSYYGTLTKAQQDFAYKLGVDARGEQLVEEQARRDRKLGTLAKRTGKVHLMESADKAITELAKSKNKEDQDRLKATLKARDVLSFITQNITHGNIYLFASEKTADGKYVVPEDLANIFKGRKEEKDIVAGTIARQNGIYDSSTGDIYIDVNAGTNYEGVILMTAAHELTHFIRDWSPVKFRVLGDFLIQQYQEANVPVDKLIQRRIARTGASYDEEYEEMVADSMGKMLTDKNVYDKLIALKAKDNNLFLKLKAGLEQIVESIKNAYKQFENVQTVEANYSQTIKDLDRLQTLFAEALVDAGERYGSASGVEGGSVVDNAYSDTAYSVRPPFNKGKKLTTWVESLSPEARQTYDLFEKLHTIGDSNRIDLGLKDPTDIVGRYMRANEWNDLCKSNPEFARVAKELAKVVPTNLKVSMNEGGRWLNDDGTMAIGEREAKLKMKRSFIQRILDNMPPETVSSLYTINGKQYKLSDKDTMASVGGDAYRRALLETVRKLYRDGELENKSLSSLAKDTWGALGWIRGNQKTGASGDFSTFCPQMYYNLGCWYCYRRAALESNVDNANVGTNIWYTGELLYLSQEDIKTINKAGGLRIQSFGDWFDEYASQLADVIADAETRGLQVKIITKEPSMVEAVARMKEQGLGQNVYFNISADYTWEEQGIDVGEPFDDGRGVKRAEILSRNAQRPFFYKVGEDGKRRLYWKRALSVDEAYELRQKYPWVNVRVVATNLKEFITALKDPRIQVVTGYHGRTKKFTRVDPTTHEEYLDKKGYRRISSLTGDALVEVEALGNKGMPSFRRNKNGEWEQYYRTTEGKNKAGETVTKILKPNKAQRILADEILKNNLVEDYYAKACCTTGNCAECQTMCGLGSITTALEQFLVQNVYTTPDIREFWAKQSDILGEKVRIPQNYTLKDILDRKSDSTTKFSTRDSSFDSKFDIMDDGRIKVKSLDALSMEDWGVIQKAVKKIGYTDIRSAKQAKEVFSDYIAEHGFMDDQSKAIMQAYGVSEQTKTSANPTRAKKAKKVFGTTGDFREAGYLLQDGTMLDFSGVRDGGEHGVRYMDHREIAEVFDESLDSQTAYMNAFISEGNIRLMESQGVTIGEIEPSAAQYSMLKKFIEHVLKDEGYFYLDLSNEKGYTIESREYGEKDSASKIINDIKAYFKDGELPYRSELQQFRYSERDSQGRELTKAQQEYFKDSVIRDKNGSLLTVYHGSPATDITVFDKNMAGRHTNAFDERAIWFTANKEFADDFSYEFNESKRSMFLVEKGKKGKVYESYLNITNPFDFTNLTDDMKELLYQGADKYSSKHSVIDELIEYQNHQYLKTFLDFNTLEENGYDGVIARLYTPTQNKGDDLEYGVLNSNQIKATDNQNPTESPDIRFSTRDSEGRNLTLDQAEYFKDSKARDDKGRLIPLFHGTENAGFTRFDSSHGNSSPYFFFTDDEIIAKGYSGTRERVKLPHFDSINEATEYISRDMFNPNFAIEKDGSEYVIYDEGDEAARNKSLDDAVLEYAEYLGVGGSSGNYKVYLNLTNPLVIDAKGNYWQEIKVDWQDEPMTTNSIADYAKEHGYDGLIIKNVSDYGLYSSTAEQVHTNDYVAFEANQIKDVDNLNPTEKDDIRFSERDNIGYHAGDLGKAESLGSQSGGRDTGHFGTGTYFVGNEAKISDSHYGSRPHEAVDFSKYNLFRPKNYDDGIALHEFLKGVNDYYDRPDYLVNNEDELEERKEAFETAYDIMDGYDDHLYDELDGVVHLERLIGIAENVVSAYDINRILTKYMDDKVWIGDDAAELYDSDMNRLSIETIARSIKDEHRLIAELEQAFDDLYVRRRLYRREAFLDSFDKVADILGIDKDDIQPMIDNIGREISEANYSMDERYTADSASTRFMKALGYEGVNVNGIEGLDNTMYGSVIYDLKDEDLARKQEIGTAKWSERNPEALRQLSDRELLMDAEDAHGEIQEKRLVEFKEKNQLLESLKDDLRKSNDKEMSTKLRNRIDVIERQVVALEKSKALQNVLSRQRDLAEKRRQDYIKGLDEQYRERLEKQREDLTKQFKARTEKARAKRTATELRHRITKKVNELSKLLLSPDSKHHVPKDLRPLVAEALDALDLTSPRQGERTRARLNALKDMYKKIANTTEPTLQYAYDESITEWIEAISEDIGDTPFQKMSVDQLESLYNLYSAVLATVRNANKTFAWMRNRDITELSEDVISEVKEVGGVKEMQAKWKEFIKRHFYWNNMKPIYAMRAIGSDTLTKLYENVRHGEDVFANDTTEAKNFAQTQKEKYGYDSWDLDERFEFKTADGKSFSLNLMEMMSLYEYYKRPQADAHLRQGGFVFEDNTIKKRNKLGMPIEYKVNTADTHRVDPAMMAKIAQKLTPEQKDFADAMQRYLAEDMGAKGNEVSEALYDIDLYTEKHYFPLKSSRLYLASKATETAGDKAIKNAGMTKSLIPNANNPIILQGLMDVWTDHVNEMSMYHAFVLPLEDFQRVYNYKTSASDENASPEGVRSAIRNAYGDAANSYIHQMLVDLNGGARPDPRAGLSGQLVSRFKSGAVLASASVVIQQPSAVVRAFAYIDPKYFVQTSLSNLNLKAHSAEWEEVKRYAPVAKIKEMGYFDTGMGTSTQEWLKEDIPEGFANKAKALVTDSNYRSSVLAKAPELADEITWTHIWKAAKAQTLAENPDLEEGSQEHLEKAGELFTKTVTNTQVYDSVLSRSAMMRSKDGLVKTATAFMAEPTTSINMVVDALIQAKRMGSGKEARRIIASVLGQIILNAMLVSIVYAARDDDDEKTYVEKYVGQLAKNTLDNANPMTMIPYLKDVVSLIQGYDVERADMSVIGDIVQAYKRLTSGEMSFRKVEDFTGQVLKLFGIPVGNVMRDIRGIENVINGFMSDNTTSLEGIRESVLEEVTGKSATKIYSNDLGRAVKQGDTAKIKSVIDKWVKQKMKSGKTEKEAKSSIQSTLTSTYKPLFLKAYQKGDQAEMARIRKALKATGIYKDVVKTTQDWIKSLKD